MKKWLSATALALTLVFSGTAYAHDDWHAAGEHHKGPPPFMEEALSKLPKKDAGEFRDTMKQAHEKNKALIGRMRKLRDERLAILSAPKFDRDAWLAKGDELMKFRKSMHEQMRENMQGAFAEALGNLSQSDRKILAASMEHMDHGHPWDHHRGHDGGDHSAAAGPD